jgi:hypothetical protein
MFQQILALIIILFFLSRIVWQKKKKQINNNEFIFWLFFWIIAGFAIINIKMIDRLVAQLGFSGSGIEILFYLAIIILIYLVFKIRIRQAKIEKNITDIVRNMALKK